MLTVLLKLVLLPALTGHVACVLVDAVEGHRRLHLRAFVTVLVPSYVVVVPCLLVAWIGRNLTHGQSDDLTLLIAFFTVGGTWIVAVWFGRPPLRDELET